MSDTAREIFVKNLHYFMEAMDVSQADIVRELRVSSATVSDWCSGKKYPRIDKMQQLADLLGIHYSTLTTEHGQQDYEDQQRLEALHQNPRLGLLFDRARRMKKEDIDFMIQFTDRVMKERDGDGE